MKINCLLRFALVTVFGFALMLRADDQNEICEICTVGWPTPGAIFLENCEKLKDKELTAQITCISTPYGTARGHFSARKAIKTANGRYLPQTIELSGICGHSKCVKRSFDVPVLFPGETGTAKPTPGVNSLHWSVGLGRVSGNRIGGCLTLDSMDINDRLGKPESLHLAAQGMNDVVLAPFGQYVYQVLAPECFVQISEISHWSYSIEFYSPDQVSETRRTQLWHIGKRGEERIVTTLPFVSDGINSMTVVSSECYAIEESAVPFATFTVGQSGPGGMVSIVESRPGIENRTTAFAFANGTWTMNESGLRITSVSEEVGESKVKTRIVAGPNGESVETRQTYIPFEDTELLVEETVDPNGLARTTTWEYYTSGGNAVRGQLKKTIGPDGDWTSYVYDGEGRIAEQRNGWLSGNENEPSRVVRYEYAPFLATNDVSETKPFDDGKTDPTTARVETMLIGSVPVSKTLRNVALDSFGYRIIETVRLLNPAETNLVAAWNDPRNSRSLSIYMPDSDYKPCSRLPFLLVEENGTAAHYDYCSGSYTPGENGLPGTFEPVVGGSVFQTTITYGTRESFRLDENGNSASGYLGIPFQTTREVKLETRIGKHEIQTETFVCAESGTFERIAWTTKTLDSLGRVVSSRSSSGMETRKGWIGDNIAWEEDEEGIVRHYAYDALGRRTSESFVDPISSKQCVTSFEYDALDHHISKMVEADGLISVTTKTYDNCGRLVADCDGKGITTVYSYGKTPDNLLWKQTISGAGTGLGSTNVTYSFLDGQTAFETRNGKRTFTSAFGVGVTDFPYSKWQVDYLGSSGLDSPSWSAVLSDSLDRTTFGLQSAANNSVVVQSYGYDTSGNIVDVREFHAPMETNGVSSLVDVVASMVLQRSTNTVSRQLSTYDDFGNLVLTAVDVNRNGIIDLSGPDIVFSNAVSYCRVNGDWWKATEEFCFPETDSSFPVTNKVLLERMSGLGGQNATDCGSGVLFAQTKEIDGLGNERVACSYVDRINHRTFVIDSISGLSTKSYVVSMDGAIVSNRTSSGVCSSREYDALRRITAIVDGRGAKTRATYDSVGRIASTIVQGGALETYDYDEMNRPIRVENQNGEVTYLSYDTEGRIVSRRGALHPADCSYDENGKLASFTTYRDDSLTGGDTTFRTYDPSTGLLLSIVYADGKETTFAYDAVGNLVSRTWARGVTTAYGYDELNRIVTVDYSDGTPGVRYAYDRVGNVVSAIVEGVSTNLYYYNRYGDVTNEVQNGVSIVRNYDQYGRPTGYIIPGASCTGANVVYSYDGQGRIASVISGPHRFDYTFVPGLNEPLSMQTEAGFSWNRRLDDVSSQIVESANHYGTNLISRYSYGLDSLGHRVSRHEEGLAFPIETEEFFEYNDRSELTNSTRFCITGSGTRIPWRGSRLEYRYDQAGNRISDSEFAGDETLVQHYAVNELNQYVSVDNPDSMAVRGVVSGNSVVSVNGRTACQTFVDGTLSVWDATIPRTALGSGFIDFTCLAVQSPESGLDIVQETPGILYLPASEQSFQYDADGNMVSDGRWQYSWNADNRMTEARELVSVNPNSVRILRYTYDHRGRMVSKSVFVNSNLVERREYVWDGFDIICENTTRGADSSHRWNVWGLDASSGLQASGGAGGLLAVCESETIFYPAYDGNFNVVQYVDGSGDIVASAEFDPYGKPLVFDNAAKRFTHWFGTMPWCEYTKLSEYLYRSYSPHLGRWLSRDPMGEQEFSLYSYAMNSPIDSFDAFGLWKAKVAVDWRKDFFKKRFYISASASGQFHNGEGSLSFEVGAGLVFHFTDLLPGGSGTIVQEILDSINIVQEILVGGAGVGKVTCSCPGESNKMQCRLTQFFVRVQVQGRIGYQGSKYRIIASAKGGGQMDLLTGATSIFYSFDVRAQRKTLGVWIGFSYGSADKALPLPFTLPTIKKTSFSVSLPKTCACMDSDIDVSSPLEGLL